MLQNFVDEEKNNLFEDEALSPEIVSPDAATSSDKKEESLVVSLKNQLALLTADFDNYKKRVSKEQLFFYEQSKIDFVKAFLPVIDDLVLGLDALEKSNAGENVCAGMKLVIHNFEKILKNLGVSEVKTEIFDPELHEAISQMSQPGKSSGEILIVVKKGFMLGDKVLRHAQVVVSA